MNISPTFFELEPADLETYDVNIIAMVHMLLVMHPLM